MTSKAVIMSFHRCGDVIIHLDLSAVLRETDHTHNWTVLNNGGQILSKGSLKFPDLFLSMESIPNTCSFIALLTNNSDYYGKMYELSPLGDIQEIRTLSHPWISSVAMWSNPIVRSIDSTNVVGEDIFTGNIMWNVNDPFLIGRWTPNSTYYESTAPTFKLISSNRFAVFNGVSNFEMTKAAAIVGLYDLISGKRLVLSHTFFGSGSYRVFLDTTIVDNFLTLFLDLDWYVLDPKSLEVTNSGNFPACVPNNCIYKLVSQKGDYVVTSPRIFEAGYPSR